MKRLMNINENIFLKNEIKVLFLQKFDNCKGMPAIYEYFGILILFYSNEHVPVHVHARYGEFENVYEFIVNDGTVVAFKKRKIKNKPELPDNKAKQAEKLIKTFANDILQKWFEFFVLNKEIFMEKITQKL